MGVEDDFAGMVGETVGHIVVAEGLSMAVEVQLVVGSEPASSPGLA